MRTTNGSVLKLSLYIFIMLILIAIPIYAWAITLTHEEVKLWKMWVQLARIGYAKLMSSNPPAE